MRQLFLIIALTVLSFGCGGGGSEAKPASPSIPPSAPRELTATDGPIGDQVILQWVGVANSWGYLLEVKVGSDEFFAINNLQNLIPTQDTQLTLSYSDTTPELTDFTFRMKTVKGALVSSYSNEAVHHRTLNRPSSPSAYFDPMTNVITLDWIAQSARATGSLLERARCDGSGALLSPWTPLPLSGGLQTRYQDSDLMESTYYTYRVSNTFEQTVGHASSNSHPVVTAPLFCPSSFTVSPCPTGFRLAWTNRSSTTPQIKVLRDPPNKGDSTIAELPGNATFFEDLGLPSGYYSYQLEVSNQWNLLRTEVISVVKTPDSGALVLSSRPLDLPKFTMAVLRPQGTWALISGYPNYDKVFSVGDPWPELSLVGVHNSFYPNLSIDTLGWPHVSLSTYAPQGGGGLPSHYWYDGVRWQSEVVSSRETKGWLTTSYFPSAMGPDGTPRLIINLPSELKPAGGGTEDLMLLSRALGAWHEESLAPLSPSIPFITSLDLTFDRDGRTHILVGSSSTLTGFSRETDGGPWTSATVAVGIPYQVSEWRLFKGVWQDARNGNVLFDKPTPGHPLGDRAIFAIQIKDGAWGDPIPIAYLRSYYPIRIAHTPDGTRIAVSINTDFGFKVFDLRKDGWHESLLGRSNIWETFVGFDAGDQLHVLAWDDSQNCYIEWKE